MNEVTKSRLHKFGCQSVCRIVTCAENKLWCIPFVIVLIGLSIFAWMKPSVGWDVFGYTGSALTLLGESQVHEKTFAMAAKDFPDDYKALTTDDPHGRESTYRSTMAADATAFAQQLPYYQIRPAYVALLAGAYALSFSPMKAMILISVLSSFGLGLLVYRRLTRAFNPASAFLVTTALLLVFRYQFYAGHATVDPLLGFLFVALVFQFEKGMSFLAVLIAVLGLVAVRSNAVVFTTPLIAVGLIAHYFDLSVTRLNLKQASIIFLASVLMMKLIEGVVGNYGWWTVFHFTFIESLNFPAEFTGQFQLSAYFAEVIKGARWLLSDRSATTFFLGLVLMIIHLLYTAWHPQKPTLMLFSSMLLVIFVGHFVLFPAVFLRFYFPVFVLAWVYLLVGLAANTENETG